MRCMQLNEIRWAESMKAKNSEIALKQIKKYKEAERLAENEKKQGIRDLQMLFDKIASKNKNGARTIGNEIGVSAKRDQKVSGGSNDNFDTFKVSIFESQNQTKIETSQIGSGGRGWESQNPERSSSVGQILG